VSLLANCLFFYTLTESHFGIFSASLLLDFARKVLFQWNRGHWLEHHEEVRMRSALSHAQNLLSMFFYFNKVHTHAHTYTFHVRGVYVYERCVLVMKCGLIYELHVILKLA
jgi:hypothetical protein